MASKRVPREMKTPGRCQLCTETALNPKSLPCGHQVCANCLQQLASSSVMADTPECQLCGLKYTVSKEGLAEVLADQQVRDLHSQQSTNDGQAATIQVSEPPAQSVLCTNEEDGPATVFCSDCHQFYCEKCTACHKIVHRRHTTRPVDQMTADDVTQAKTKSTNEKAVCAEHELPLNIVCKKCDTMICATCALFDHNNHLRRELSKCAKDAQIEINYIIGEATEYIEKHINIGRDMKITDSYIRKSVEVAKTKAKKSVGLLFDIVKNHAADLNRDLDRFEKEARSKVALISQNATNNKVAATRIKKGAESLLQSRKALDQVQLTPVKQRELDVLRQSDQENVTWNFVTADIEQSEQTLKALLGSVKLNSSLVTRPWKINLGQPLHTVALQYEGVKFVTGLVVVADCIFVTHFDDPHLWLYNLTTGHHKKCSIPDLRHPCGMALLPSGKTVVITDQSTAGGKLHFVDITQSTEMRVSPVSVKTLPNISPYRISLSRDGTQLLIGLWGHSKFLVCDLSGTVQREITVKSPDKSLRWPLCVTGTEEGYAALMAHKYDRSTIQFMDINGNCKHAYGDKDEEQMTRAPYMTSASQTGLVVADRGNNRLHLVSSTDDFSQLLLTHSDGIVQPSCLYIDEPAARLYVAYGPRGSREIRVYRWPCTPGNLKTTKYALTLNVAQLS